MSDVRSILERGVGGATPPPDGFERMLRRHDRKRRSRRISAGVLGLTIALAGALVATNAIRSDPGPGETPSPIPTPAPEPAHTPRMQITLTPTACDFGAPKGPIRLEGPPHDSSVTFRAVNRTDGVALFDIGRLREGHTLGELKRDVENADLGGSVGDRRPAYFEGHLQGYGLFSHGAGFKESLLSVSPHEETTWVPVGRRSRVTGTYAVICYGVPTGAGDPQPIGAVGIVEVR
jgi:hypothetical protein